MKERIRVPVPGGPLVPLASDYRNVVDAAKLHSGSGGLSDACSICESISVIEGFLDWIDRMAEMAEETVKEEKRIKV